MLQGRGTFRDDLRLLGRLGALAKEAHPDLLSACRRITPGDEFALSKVELEPLRRSHVSVRRASGAARLVAKQLLQALGGTPHIDLPRSTSGAPRWPRGFVGSLAHDEEFAVAVVASSHVLRGAGVDVEPRAPLPAHLLTIVATDSERRQLEGDLIAARQLFCMKEAVYKATNPLDGVFLEYHDIEVCMKSGIARTSSGHTLRIHTADSPRLLAVTIMSETGVV